MTAYALLEPGIVGVLVAGSLWTALSKLAPGWKDRLLGRTKPAADATECGTCRGCERGTALRHELGSPPPSSAPTRGAS